ncbi:MAG: hypothetical protein U5P41_15760 [Gammaproteobacteria bacterium]|nr:hypothetical protein [Gammaproteobacteria bacterium]
MTRKILILLLTVVTPIGWSYPIDGHDYTHIQRLKYTNALRLPPGARLPLSDVLPSGDGITSLPDADSKLSARIKSALGDHASNYSVAVLDISDHDQPLYAAHNENHIANIGSVGKFLVLFALFDKLARLYPDDIEARERVLRDSSITVNDWIVHDSHTVPIVDADSGEPARRKLHIGDRGNLWEFLDWMASASSNAAASMVVQQVILLEHFGRDYPAEPSVTRRFLEQSSPGELGELWLAAMQRPLEAAGFDTGRIRQGSPFTATAKRYVSGTSSVGNVRDLVRLLNLIEAERFVDPWSSRETKRLLYMTERRIRYASHPALNNAAVYFKSGSYYSCEPEPDFLCRKYRGNRINRLASIAIIESPADSPALRYMVAVMSNVLYVNSAVAHQTLAMRIHRLIEAQHQSQSLQESPEAASPYPSPISHEDTLSGTP